MRQACGEAALHRTGRCVRLPLRGQHRLARLRCRQAPCFPFNCTRRNSAREHQNACECRRRCGERQGKTGRHGACGTAAASCLACLRRPRGGFARAGRCAIVCAAFGARMRITRTQLNGKQEAEVRLACAVPATVRRPRARFPPHAPRPPAMPLPFSGREGCGLASGQPGYRPTQGASPPLAETPDPRGTDEVRLPPAFARASPDPSCLACPPAADAPLALSFPLP